MKTFKCVICGGEVSKRQSSAFNDGRACKKHQETKDRLIFQRNKESHRIAAEQEKTKKKKATPVHSKPGMIKCWSCKEWGISFRTAMLNMLVSTEKVQMRHDAIGSPVNFLDMMNEAQKDARSKITTRVIAAYPVPEEKIEEVMLSVDFILRSIIRQEKLVSFCHVCAAKCGLTMTLPKVDTKTLFMMGGVYKETIQSTIQELAKDEMAEEAIQN